MREKPSREDIAQEKAVRRERLQSRTARNRFLPHKKNYKILVLMLGVLGIAFLAAIMVLNTLPGDLTILLSVSMIAMLIAVSMMLARERKQKQILGLVLAVLFIVLFGSVTAFMTDTYITLNKISEGGISATGPIAKKVSVTNEPFNLYVTGIDQWEEDEGLDLERSDVNMIITVNPVTKKVLLTSIPRDSYVRLHTSQQMDKLTHSGIYGVDETLSTVEDWLDIDLNYYVKMNFTATEELIDAIGGIDVYSPVAFEGSLQGNKYQQGWNHLDGWDALYFARERKSFEGKDEIRVENQQRVMEAVIKKVTSSKALLSNYGEIMQVAGRNLSTNISSEEVLSLVKMQITELSDWDVETQKISGTDGMDYVASLTQSQKFSVYYPDDAAVESAKASISGIMNPTQEEIKEAESSKSRSFFVNLVKSVIKSGKDGDRESKSNE